MNIEASVTKETEAFKQIVVEICKDMEGESMSAAGSVQFAAKLKEAICVLGASVLSAFYEACDEEREELRIDGKRYIRKAVSEKQWLTPFGVITVARNLYQQPFGGPTHFPIDERVGMQGEFATPDVREMLVYASNILQSDQIEDFVGKCGFFQPKRTAIRNIIRETGELVEEHLDQIQDAIHEREHKTIEEEPTAPGDVIATSLDGANVLLREKGNKRGRPAQRPGKDKSGSCESSYKNAMVGSVSIYRASKDPEIAPERLYSRYVARMPEERAPTVKRLLEKEVSQAESLVDANATKILLMDGSRALWNYAKSTPCFEGYEFLIDYYHACEHLSAAAEALFGKETEQSKVWYRRWKGKLYEEEGAAQALIRSIDYYTDNNRLSPSRKKEVRNQRTFFLNGKDRMNYAEFIERGLPIGSGPVEAACKTIVKQRMCRSGQRWTRNGGQHIMNIRTIVQSNRWDSFWNACEQIRLAA